MAMVMLGMFALNPVGITGSIVQQLNHGISTGALFLLVGVVYERRHTREISEYGGLSKVMPVYAAVFLVMTMSSIGLPALNGFIGEFLILQGVFVAQQDVGGVRGERRRARRGLHAVSVSADDVRQDREPEERAAARPEPCASSRRSRRCIVLAVWMGLYPAPFLRPARHVGAARRRARRARSTRSRRRARAATRRRRRSCWRPTRRGQFLAAAPCGPDGQPLDAGTATPRQTPERRADAARHLAQRLLLHPAGAGAHGAARCSC